jgi:hypothetical protein
LRDEGTIRRIVSKPVRSPEDAEAPVRVLADPHLGSHEAGSQAAFGQLEAESLPAQGVVVAHPPLFLNAQDVASRPVGIGDEGRSILLGLHGEAAVVVVDVDVPEEVVGAFDAADPGKPEFLGQAVLERSKRPLRTAPRLRGVGGDVLDAELTQGAADLGQLAAGNLPAGLGRMEIVAAPVGVERTEQAFAFDRLQKPPESRRRPFLLDMKAE